MFTARTSRPSNNKYYIRKENGGYNGAILGKPTDPTANVLANCVGYANGRFAEIIGKDRIEYQLTCNAEGFINRARELGLSISKNPTLGGIMVWSDADGAGHVAIVERIDGDSVFTSESGYGVAKTFWNSTRTNSNGRWGQKSNYTYLGCIVNPSVKESGEGYMFRTETVSKGSEGKSTLLCQKILLADGYKGADGKALTLDGKCGNNTVHAINAFQDAMRRKGIECGKDGRNDGTCGTRCWEALLAL